MVKRISKRVAQQNRQASGWQQESEAINRDKARRLRRKSMRRRALVALGVTGGAYAALLAGWLWQSGHLQQMQVNFAGWAEQKLVQTGMVVQAVSVTGQTKLTPEMIVAQAELKPNTPMFSLSLAELKAKLEAHPQIASAQLERIYPNELAIEISERTPVAIWQHAGEKQWMDGEGALLQTQWVDTNSAPEMLVVTGEDAPKHMPELQQILQAVPGFRADIRAAQWVGNRRFNLVLKHDVKVLLPMDAPAKAWQKLAELEQQFALLERAVKQIDLRIEGRVFVRYEEEGEAEETFFTASL